MYKMIRCIQILGVCCLTLMIGFPILVGQANLFSKENRSLISIFEKQRLRQQQPNEEEGTNVSESFRLHLSQKNQSDELLYPLQEDSDEESTYKGDLQAKKKKQNPLVNKIKKKRPPLTKTIKKVKKKKKNTAKQYRYYLIRKGDTLYSIARRFGISVNRLKRINRIKNVRRVRVGRRLRIPVKKGVYHVVRWGENLRKISSRYRRYNVSVQSIARANRLRDPNYLQAGSVLWIPGVLNLDNRRIKPQNFLFLRPVKGKITSRVGFRWHPVYQKKLFHSGVDIKAPYGYPVRSAQKGIVNFAGWKKGYGKLVIIKHVKGMSTWYGHLSSLYVRKGQRVHRGKRIGKVGVTGLTTGPHLHFEVRKKSKPQKILNRFHGLKGRVGRRWS